MFTNWPNLLPLCVIYVLLFFLEDNAQVEMNCVVINIMTDIN